LQRLATCLPETGGIGAPHPRPTDRRHHGPRTAHRGHALVVWGVFWDLPAYPERYAARLVTARAQSQSASPPAAWLCSLSGGRNGLNGL